MAGSLPLTGTLVVSDPVWSQTARARELKVEKVERRFTSLNLSHVICHMSHVKCQRSHFTCHMSRVTYTIYINIKILQCGLASWLRVYILHSLLLLLLTLKIKCGICSILVLQLPIFDRISTPLKSGGAIQSSRIF